MNTTTPRDPEQLAQYVQDLLDWLANLEATIGREVLINHAPNNIPSRLTMRRAAGPLNYIRAPDVKSPEHKMFVKEQRSLIAGRMAEPEPEPRAAWEITRDRWRAKGYNIHALHGFKTGPLPGCNAMYGPDIPCSASIDEHCQCGYGDHQALSLLEASERDEVLDGVRELVEGDCNV